MPRHRRAGRCAEQPFGAGAFNLVNPIAGAYAERSPVVVIAGAPGARERASGFVLHHQARSRGGHGDEPDLPARAAGPARAVEINLACHQGHVATVEQRGRGHLAGVDRAAAAERDQRIGADPLGLARTELAGTCCPTPANTPAQCGPIAAVTRSRSGEAPKVLPVATSARVAPIRSSSAPRSSSH